MPIDTSMYSNIQAPQIANPMDLQNKALTMKSLAMQNQQTQQSINDQQGYRQAFQNNVTTGPDGKTTLNRAGVMSDLYKLDPSKAVDTNRTFNTMDSEDRQTQLDLLTKQTDMKKQLVMSMTDEPSYQAARNQAIALKLPNADKIPEHYDPNYVKQMQYNTLAYKEQIDEANRKRELDLREREVNAKRGETTNARIDKYAKAFKDDMDPDKGRSGNFGKLSAKVLSAGSLETLVNQYKDSGGNLPKAQMEELSMGLANMLTNSNSPAVSQIQALVPHTLMGNAQDAASWLMNEPKGANQQAFVSKMMDTISREKQTATDQLNAVRAARLPAHAEFKRLAPQQYAAGMQSYGIDESNIVNGKYVPQSQDHSLDDLVAEKARRDAAAKAGQ